MFVAISQKWKPFITDMEVRGIGQGGPSRVVVRGLYADIMETLKGRLNFSIENVENLEVGWDHMVSEVSAGRADLGLTGFSHTYDRILRVDFSVPFSGSSIRLLYGRRNEMSPLHVYLGSFLQDAW